MKSLVQNIKEIFFSNSCSVCNKISEKTYICDECYKILRKKMTLKNIGNYYFVCYYDEDIRKVIADFKLKNRRKIGKEIASLIDRHIKELISDKKIDCIIPVPISLERRKERGFNQVEEILDNCKLDYLKIERDKNTKHMYEILDNRGRKENIYNAFSKKKLNIDGKNILIVDDIVTTGHTIKELIKSLRINNNPKEIYVFSVAVSKIFRG